MDLLASRVARDGKTKGKSIKTVNKVSKVTDAKIIPKVDTKGIKKPLKKQKNGSNLAEISSKNKKLIKDTLTEQQKKENKGSAKDAVLNILKKNDLKKQKSLEKDSKKAKTKNNQTLNNKTNVLPKAKKQTVEKLVVEKTNNKSKEPQKLKNLAKMNVKSEKIKKEVKENIVPVKLDSQNLKSADKQQPKPLKADKKVQDNKKVNEPKQQKIKKNTVETNVNDLQTLQHSNSISAKSRKVEEVKPVQNKKAKKRKAAEPSVVTTHDSPKKIKGADVQKKANDQLQKQQKGIKSKKFSKKGRKNLLKTEDNAEIKNVKSKKRKGLIKEGVKTTHSSLTKPEIVKYVKAFLKVIESKEKKKNNLFNTEKPALFLLIEGIKVPKVPLHQLRIQLPHCYLSDNDDVILFVKDIKKGRRRDYENSKNHYEDLLKNEGCTQIKTIMPFNQVKTEYNQYEMKRRLLNSYDHFLSDGRISGHLCHVLGKEFRLKRKLPVSVRMGAKNLKLAFDVALRKTNLQIHSNGNSSTVQVGTCSMTQDKIAENILAVIKKLHTDFPGGWENIRAIRLKTPQSIALPIYITLKNKNTVKVPVIKPKRPKAYKDVTGELSTYTSNTNVTVSPDGTVTVIKEKRENYSGSDLSDESEDEQSDIKVKTKAKVKQGKEKTDVNEKNEDKNDEDDEDDDDEVEGDEEDDDDEN